LLFLAWQGIKVAKLEATGIRAEGQVVRMKRMDPNYRAIVTFRTQDNYTIEFEDFAYEALPIFPSSPYPGKRVTVLYLANDPGYAIIDHGRFWNWVRVLSPFLNIDP
jgi:hypothetical protein